MRYVHRVQKNGVEHLYFRKRGAPSRPLRAAWGTPELGVEVASILEALRPAKAVPGTIKAAALVYEKGPDFHRLAASTQYEYGLILKELVTDFGGVLVITITGGRVLAMRDAWAWRGHRATAIRLTVLEHVLRPGIVAGLIPGGNPFVDIPAVRRLAAAPEPHPIWPAAVVNEVIAAARDRGNPGLARAVAIARYQGARRGDLVKLTRGARADGRFRFLSGKRRIPVDMPEDPELTNWLTALPDHPAAKPRAGRKLKHGEEPTAPITLVFNLAGRPYTEDGVGQELSKLLDDLHKAGRIGSASYDLHGLRHTRGVELALAGCTDAQGAAALGHASPASFAQYRRQADRIRLADDAAAKIRALREQLPNGGVETGVATMWKPA